MSVKNWSLALVVAVISSATRNPLFAVKEAGLVALERLMRQLYWSVPTLRRWWRRQRSVPRKQVCQRAELRRYLESIGVHAGALVMAHTGMNGVEIHDDKGMATGNTLAQAQGLLDDLIDLVGPKGTLVMPTHAKYQQDDDADDAGSLPATIVYDSLRTPCRVGLVNELFWRRKGVKRSLFPHNMLAAFGSLADELLRGNLHGGKPSAHGADSGYYRICQHKGFVVSIGVPLRECLTLAHVVEEVRPDWPIRDFFTERRFCVVQADGTREWTIRLRHEKYARFCYCRRKMGRDLINEGVIHEGRVGTVYVDWAKADEIFEFFQRHTTRWPYPYYGIWMT